jgi:hypothetical protein
MSDTDTFGPVGLPPAQPVSIAPEDDFVVPGDVGGDEAERVARKAILEGVLRPADIARATLDRPRLVHVPFWRVELVGSGFSIRLNGSIRIGDGPRLPIPSAGVRDKEAIELVLARTVFPFDATKSLSIRADEMEPRRARPLDGEVIEPDVTREAAESEASRRIRRAMEGSNTIYTTFEARVRSRVLCRYPLWIVRYRYVGEAAPGPTKETFFVVVSARTGKTACSRHPSAARAVTAKVRRFLSRVGGG